MADEKMAVCSLDRKRSRREADCCVVGKAVHSEGEGDREGAALSDQKMAVSVCSAVDRKRFREGADYRVVEVVDPEGEVDGEDAAMSDQKMPVSVCSPVDPGDDYVELTWQEVYSTAIPDSDLPDLLSELKLFINQERTCRPEGVCTVTHGPKIPRSIVLLGQPARQVFSINIHLNAEYHNRGSIKIHGAIMLYGSSGRITELFARSEKKPVVFNSREGKLSLPLQGPNEAWAFDAQNTQAYVCLLKCNGADIFEAPSHDKFQKGCSVFPPGDAIVGCGIISLPVNCAPVYPCFSRNQFRGSPIAGCVAFVEAEMRTMMRGMVGVVKFTALRDLSLSGTISARSCFGVHSIVLFQTNQKEKEEVKMTSTGLIPLSRNMIAVDSRSSLLIKIRLFDGNTNENLVNETLQFNVDKEGTSYEKTTWCKATKTFFVDKMGTRVVTTWCPAINVKVDWILPSIQFPAIADEKMAVCSLDRKWSCHEADYCVVGKADHEGEGAAMSDQKMSVSVCSPMDPGDEHDEIKGEEHDDYVELTWQEVYSTAIPDSDLPDLLADLNHFINQKRTCRPEGVCTVTHGANIPRSIVFLGKPARQVFSINIHLNLNVRGSIKIHGAIMLHGSRGCITELFARSVMKPLVFNEREQARKLTLTLPLQGPNEAWAFDAQYTQMYVCLLQCNGADIFEAPSHDGFQEGCSVFPPGPGHAIVGCGYIYLPVDCAPVYPGFSRTKFDGSPIAGSVAFVEAEMRTMMRGMVGRLEFTALRDLSLSGRISARSCFGVHSIVLFQKKQKKKKIESDIN